MTVNGLATVNLSTLTGFQQALMFTLMWIGHPVTVSLIIIQSRMWIFEDHLEPLVRKRREEREARRQRRLAERTISQRVLSIFGPGGANERPEDAPHHEIPLPVVDDGKKGKVKASMIRRMSNAPQRVNPSGHVMEPRSSHKPIELPQTPAAVDDPSPPIFESPKSIPVNISDNVAPIIGIRHATDDVSVSPTDKHSSFSPESFGLATAAGRAGRMHQSFSIPEERAGFQRSYTVEFSLSPQTRGASSDVEGNIDRGRLSLVGSREENSARLSFTGETTGRSNRGGEGFGRFPSRVHTFPRTTTGVSMRRRGSLHTGFGGFPTPYRLLIRFLSFIAPNMAERVRMQLTVPKAPSMKSVPKLMAAQTIEAAIQTEHRMDEKDLEFLGGVEYKALKLLRSIVICYHIGIQVLGFSLILIDSLQPRFRAVFDSQPGYVPPVWFAAFQAASAYTNTGTSLSDASMVPFQSATVMVLVMFVLILAGNTGFPIFLRLIIWTLKKSFRHDAPIQEPLHFLLKHPRRCFVYLFPSHQTWFLFTMIVTLTTTDWLCFLILDIGNPVTEAVPVVTRVLIGLLQASAVRAAGFATISLSSLAPAVKVLYVIMMYVSVYPIAMSVRSTNVYEEKSLGIFSEEQDNDSEDSSLLSQEHRFGRREGESRTKIWGEYLIWHAKQQLAFDMWWLGLALWLICIIERFPLMDPENQSWFNIFTVLFEIVSAYGTVGMSLGVPYDNYSTSGAFSVLSKLVVIAVMIRGRHRGLPVAIDRAIVLPHEYNKKGEEHTPDVPRLNDPESGANNIEDPTAKRQDNGSSAAANETTQHDSEKYSRRVSIA
ncbi:hypothetical protein M408DRAFT_330271 [Serendipita vermifera MAFF 305830]|uniref:Potassium transport protein n=1 Tax=Serendipita vermifera MAFF 305830 TaxID=933852 RepID=A0A0C3AQQ6_SERVB|nr:hypothetical protein M408DRAFT_330271 [Serendipita vermifera MAFF 305830]